MDVGFVGLFLDSGVSVVYRGLLKLVCIAFFTLPILSVSMNTGRIGNSESQQNLDSLYQPDSNLDAFFLELENELLNGDISVDQQLNADNDTSLLDGLINHNKNYQYTNQKILDQTKKTNIENFERVLFQLSDLLSSEHYGNILTYLKEKYPVFQAVKLLERDIHKELLKELFPSKNKTIKINNFEYSKRDLNTFLYMYTHKRDYIKLLQKDGKRYNLASNEFEDYTAQDYLQRDRLQHEESFKQWYLLNAQIAIVTSDDFLLNVNVLGKAILKTYKSGHYIDFLQDDSNSRRFLGMLHTKVFGEIGKKKLAFRLYLINKEISADDLQKITEKVSKKLSKLYVDLTGISDSDQKLNKLEFYLQKNEDKHHAKKKANYTDDISLYYTKNIDLVY